MKRSHPTNAFRRIAALCLAMACLPLTVHSEPAESTGAGIPGRWSAEKANAWYDNQPWPCGFNYIPANAISYTEMWMPYLAEQIRALKEHGRPVINTEWLNRPRGSTVADCLPLFARENVGCMHWGLVNGKTQTDLGWGSRPDRPEPEVWQHDLFHGDHTPYDRKELDLFRRTIGKSRAAAAGRTK